MPKQQNSEVVATKFHLLWMPCLGGTRNISTNSTSRGSGYENMDVCDFEGMHCSNILGPKSRGAFSAPYHLPLTVAASLTDSWEVVKLLIEQGIDVKSDAGG